MSVSRAFLYISFRVHSKGAPTSRFSSQSSHRQRCSVSRSLHLPLKRAHLNSLTSHWLIIQNTMI